MRRVSGASSWPGASSWVPSSRRPDDLASAAQGCRGCDLYAPATQAVMGSGPPGAVLMLVGEQPGDQEDRAGEPFVGPAGRLLDRALGEAGLEPSSVYRTNAVKHFRFVDRGSGKRLHKSPARWQVAKCEPWLLAELEAVRPLGVVLLGATAGQAAYGTGFRVGSDRGRRLDWPEHWPTSRDGSFTVATTHPSAVLRSRERDRDFAGLVADLRTVRELVGADDG
jgi:uracil-DNA glycosylase